jgi:hypothetical protein
MTTGSAPRIRHQRAALAAAAGAVAAGAALAATLDSIEVTHEDDVYSLLAETTLDASPEAIHAVLIDYDRFSRISSVYKEHGYLAPAPDGTPIVFTRMEGCLTRLFCKSMTRVERLEIDTIGHIRTVTIPEQSDFKQSVSEWFIEPQGSGARVTYSLLMEPDFWVPPLIGPAYLQHKLRSGGGTALQRIERLAQELEQEGIARVSSTESHTSSRREQSP